MSTSFTLTIGPIRIPTKSQACIFTVSFTPPDEYTERLRTTAQYNDIPVVQIEMDSFMTGPGAFARASEASFVQDFFAGTTGLVDGTYTKEDLINNHGYTEEDFQVTLAQYEGLHQTPETMRREAIFSAQERLKFLIPRYM